MLNKMGSPQGQSAYGGKTITSILAVWLFTILMLTAGTNSTYAEPRFGFYMGIGTNRVFNAERRNFDRVWVEGHYKYNKYGRLVWVPAHWKDI